MASGDTLIVLLPFNNEPPSTNPATPTKRNFHPVLDFDATVNESAVFTFILPRHYAGGGITVYYHIAMTSAVSGDVDIDGQFERIGNGIQDIDTDGFAAVKSIDNTVVPATSGLVLRIAGPTFANGAEIDSLEAGELGRFKVLRDAAADTATGDMELLAIEFVEA